MRRTSPEEEEEVVLSKASQLAVRKRKRACAFASYFSKRKRGRKYFKRKAATAQEQRSTLDRHRHSKIGEQSKADSRTIR